MGYDMTVSHWRWHVDSLDTGAGIQLGQCQDIMCIISIIVPLIVQTDGSNVRTNNIVVLNKIILRYIYLYIPAACFAIDVYI